MSVVQNPIIGRASGKFSTAILQKWKNKNVLRSKPLTVANPKTPAQTMRRSMFSALVEIGRNISPILIIGFNGFKSTLTWMNVFLQKNLDTFIVPGVAPNFMMVPTEGIISQGPLTITPITSVLGVDGSATVTVTYPTILSAPDQAATDFAHLVVFNFTQELTTYAVGSSSRCRADGSITLTMPANSVSGDQLYAYLFFERADGSMVSSNTVASFIVV